jgi:hypothetical protein
VNPVCGCDCNCPIILPDGDEIRSREEHRKILQDRIETFDRKIAGLKTVKGP